MINNATLKKGEVELIKVLLKEGYKQMFISKMFKVSQSNIGMINTGYSWAWL
jgi:transcriptional regulator